MADEVRPSSFVHSLVVMEARKLLIAQATKAARGLATEGQMHGTVLKNQASDPTELLVGNGFPNVSYDAVSGDATIDWSRGTPNSKFVAELNSIVKMAEDAKRAEVLLRVWAVLRDHFKYDPSTGPVVLYFNSPRTSDLYASPPSLPQQEPLIAFLGECGLAVDKITTNPGNYPSMKVECHYQ